MCRKEYALYRGEECLAIGTIREIAKQQGVHPSTIRFYKSPAYLRRRANSKTGNYKVLICLEEDDDE